MSFREPCHSFRFLKEQAQKAHVKPTYKSQIVSALEYFEQQSLCDLDRRDSPLILRSRFREFKDLIKNIPIFETGGAQAEDAWRMARCFAFDEEPSSLIVPSIERPKKKTAEEQFKSYEVADFFSHLLRDYVGFIGRAKAHGLSSPGDEETFVRYGLEFLIASSYVPKIHRKMREMKATWEKLNPILKRTGLMDQFKGAQSIEYRLRLFLRD